MGKTRTPTFRVEIEGFARISNMAYSKTATDAGLAEFVATLEATTKPGGTNEHLVDLGIRSARVIRQSSGVVVAEYRKPW